MRLMGSEWLIIPAVSFCVALATYLWAGRVIEFLKKKSLGNRAEILRILDTMFVQVEEKKITILLLLLSFGLGTIFFLLLLPNVIAGLMFASIVTVAGWTVPMIFVKSIYERRCNLFNDQMIDGLTIMANGVKSGLTVTQSMERVVDNLPNPIAQEFALVLSQIRIGRSVEEALIELGERIPRADVQMFVTAINILKETGGNLAETFQTIVVTIRERQKLEKKIQAMTAQGMMQGVVITLVPFALMIIFFFVNPGYISPMFTTTMGLIMLFLMFALQIIGGVMIRRIVKIKV